MITAIEPGRNLRITGSSKSQIENELSTAVVLVRQRAREALHGILITRLGTGSYTVAVDPSVPYGITVERDTWTARGLGSDSGGTPEGLLH
jgi:hypothetical protein